MLRLVTSAVEAPPPTEETTCRTNHDTFTTSSLTHTENTGLTSFRIKCVTVKVTRLSDQLSVTTVNHCAHDLKPEIDFRLYFGTDDLKTSLFCTSE